MSALTVAEPFCGAGGLSLGLHAAGFRAIWAGEMDKHACVTHRRAFPGVPLFEGKCTGEETLDIEPGELSLLAGGPPCQPFSNAGDRLGEWDPRDGFPLFLRLIERYRPRAIFMENVKGLLARRHTDYVAQILASLTNLGYRTEVRVLQAADFGVPQRRERAIFVGFREDLPFVWPKPTHSLEALVAQKYPDALTSGEIPKDATRYEAAALRILSRAEPRAGTTTHAAWLAAQDAIALKPWVTVREALGDLVREYEPGKTLHTPPVAGSVNVELIDAGRGGHYDTEVASRVKSLLYKNTRPDVPADTVSAAAEQKGSEHCARVALVVRNLGAGDGLGARADDVAPTVPAKVAGQSGLAAMDARPSTILRRLSHAEVARLQSFPDAHPWGGPSTAIYRQIGNAVPPPLGEAVGRSIAAALEGIVYEPIPLFDTTPEVAVRYSSKPELRLPKPIAVWPRWPS